MISRKYLYLIALARERHFGRAAAACHVSPSTLSSAIRDLEAELGIAIVERGQQFSGLTAEGQCVLEHAQRAAAGSQALREALASRHGGLQGCLRIGVIPTALTRVAQFTAAFSRRHPGVRFEVLSLGTDDILARLRAFELEAGLVYAASARQPDLPVQACAEEQHVLLASAAGALAERESISWREAAGLHLCLLTRDMHNRRTIDGVFAELGCTPSVRLETNSILCLLAHVCSGQWCSIVPRTVLEMVGTPAGVRALELVEPQLAWRIAVVAMARVPQPPIVQGFIDEVVGQAGVFD